MVLDDEPSAVAAPAADERPADGPSREASTLHDDASAATPSADGDEPLDVEDELRRACLLADERLLADALDELEAKVPDLIERMKITSRCLLRVAANAAAGRPSLGRCATMLIRHGAEVAFEDERGDAVLHRACARGNLHVARALIGAGAHADAPSSHDGNAAALRLLSGPHDLFSAQVVDGLALLGRVPESGRVARHLLLIGSCCDRRLARAARQRAPSAAAARAAAARAAAREMAGEPADGAPPTVGDRSEDEQAVDDRLLDAVLELALADHVVVVRVGGVQPGARALTASSALDSLRDALAPPAAPGAGSAAPPLGAAAAAAAAEGERLGLSVECACALDDGRTLVVIVYCGRRVHTLVRWSSSASAAVSVEVRAGGERGGERGGEGGGEGGGAPVSQRELLRCLVAGEAEEAVARLLGLREPAAGEPRRVPVVNEAGVEVHTTQAHALGGGSPDGLGAGADGVGAPGAAGGAVPPPGGAPLREGAQHGAEAGPEPLGPAPPRPAAHALSTHQRSVVVSDEAPPQWERAMPQEAEARALETADGGHSRLPFESRALERALRVVLDPPEPPELDAGPGDPLVPAGVPTALRWAEALAYTRALCAQSLRGRLVSAGRDSRWCRVSALSASCSRALLTLGDADGADGAAPAPPGGGPRAPASGAAPAGARLTDQLALEQTVHYAWADEAHGGAEAEGGRDAGARRAAGGAAGAPLGAPVGSGVRAWAPRIAAITHRYVRVPPWRPAGPGGAAAERAAASGEDEAAGGAAEAAAGARRPVLGSAHWPYPPPLGAPSAPPRQRVLHIAVVDVRLALRRAGTAPGGAAHFRPLAPDSTVRVALHAIARGGGRRGGAPARERSAWAPWDAEDEPLGASASRGAVGTDAGAVPSSAVVYGVAAPRVEDSGALGVAVQWHVVEGPRRAPGAEPAPPCPEPRAVAVARAAALEAEGLQARVRERKRRAPRSDADVVLRLPLGVEGSATFTLELDVACVPSAHTPPAPAPPPGAAPPRSAAPPDPYTAPAPPSARARADAESADATSRQHRIFEHAPRPELVRAHTRLLEALEPGDRSPRALALVRSRLGGLLSAQLCEYWTLRDGARAAGAPRVLEAICGLVAEQRWSVCRVRRFPADGAGGGAGFGAGGLRPASATSALAGSLEGGAPVLFDPAMLVHAAVPSRALRTAPSLGPQCCTVALLECRLGAASATHLVVQVAYWAFEPSGATGSAAGARAPRLIGVLHGRVKSAAAARETAAELVRTWAEGGRRAPGSTARGGVAAGAAGAAAHAAPAMPPGTPSTREPLRFAGELALADCLLYPHAPVQLEVACPTAARRLGFGPSGAGGSAAAAAANADSSGAGATPQPWPLDAHVVLRIQAS